jgi:hypothetical protein
MGEEGLHIRLWEKAFFKGILLVGQLPLFRPWEGKTIHHVEMAKNPFSPLPAEPLPIESRIDSSHRKSGWKDIPAREGDRSIPT